MDKFNNVYKYTEIYELVKWYRENKISWKYGSVLLEEGEKETTQSLSKISESLDELRKLIEVVQKNQNKSNLATCKSALYRLSSELLAKGWVSQIEYETLEDLYEVYKMSTDKSLYDGKNNNIRRALSLPILTEDEIEAKIYEDAMKEKMKNQ